MAAATSTVISPMVSMPRMSTRITLTTLWPWPSGRARSTISADTDGLVRFPAATRAMVVRKSPTATDSTARGTARTAGVVRSKRSGRIRRTSRNTTTDRVSIATWVRARSGAPCTTNSRAMPYPTTPSKSAAANRRRAVVAASPPTTRSTATGTWPGDPTSSGHPGHHEPARSAAVGASTAVARMTATYTGREPDCTRAVIRAAPCSTVRTTRS